MGEQTYSAIQSFPKRTKHTQVSIASLVNHELEQIDWSNMKTLAIETQACQEKRTREVLAQFDRRLSHCLFGQIRTQLLQICEERGVRLVLKIPAFTLQTCAEC